MNTPKLYTVKEAAKLVGVSTNTLYKYLDENKIKAARGSAIQGRFRIPQESLEAFLGVKLSSPESDNTETPTNQIAQSPTSQDSMSQSLQDSVSPQPTSYNLKPNPKLPLKLARFILFLSLLAVIFDLITSSSITLASQLSRIFFLFCMLLLAYGDGGYRRS